ncbi:DUF4136 domain-containing protein [Algoriphagus lutimaris]|uniref:DUF4136 domain-containing protein n=1 Tax=Algoriphagus lutimaris TaxID=613197 RepID=UPI00196B962E|nr:DUF4136 domain-containing protein [Algoriphagus lutimaris]MBN3519061.1 DUF4136 domain-containing protein [Algoriphagus lutimaris]
MFSIKRNYALGLLLLIISSCSSIDIFKENTEIPVSRPYTSFVIINQEVGMKEFKSEFIDHQVQIHLQEALEAQGFVYDREKPDLVIRYTSNEDPRKRTTSNYPAPYPYWGYRVWDPWAASSYMNPNYGTKTTSYELLQVIIDFIDPAEDKFLMTLTGVTEVSSPKGKDKKVLKTVDKIIESFLTDLPKRPNSIENS